jgi:GNAT superfamily N-acetyltransferase
MRYAAVADPAEFMERAAPLLADEARHNLILGVGKTLLRSPEVYPDYHAFIVSADHEPTAAALMTPPYNLILADVASEEALDALVDGIATAGIAVPGAIGNQPTIGRFVERWKIRLDVTACLRMAQGVFALDRVERIETAAGSPRIAAGEDLDLIEAWTAAFLAEALPDEPADEPRSRSLIERRLGGGTPGAYWLWVDGDQVVSLSGHGNPTGRGVRIGPVYTPPEHRGKGYASALVAAESQWLLAHGYEFCFLYTDLANPTSNAIYERIGYRQVAEAASYAFQPKT